ncbi:hypothetical protein XI04_26385 [Bradyrhizobium sp. CCBAU 11430]|nr:hypothetical protein [Bradyrhizobium sp. CCBAU 11430]
MTARLAMDRARPQEFGGIADVDICFVKIFDRDRPRTQNSMWMDGHARSNKGLRSDPSVSANAYWFCYKREVDIINVM